MTNFSEEDYRDVVYSMDKYTSRLRNLYSLKNDDSTKHQRKVFNLFFSILITLGIFSLVNLIYLSEKNKPYTIQLIFGIVSITTLVISLVLINQFFRKNVNAPYNNIDELLYTRKKLDQLVRYVSQLLEHSDFSPPRRFLMDIHLSEAEEIIYLTRKVAEKHALPHNKPLSGSEFKNDKTKEAISIAYDLEYEAVPDKPTPENPKS